MINWLIRLSPPYSDCFHSFTVLWNQVLVWSDFYWWLLFCTKFNTAGGEATLQLKHTQKKPHQNNMGNNWDCPWCHSSITERDTQSCVAHPVSFVNHLLTLSQQPTTRGQADGALSLPPPTLKCHLPAWAPSTMVPALDGGCGGRRGWCCHLPQHGTLMLMDSRRSPG